MALPLVGAAAAAAARIAAKKLATRTVGGITGVGAKQVTKDFAEGNAVPIVAKTVKSTSNKNTPLVNDMLKQIKKGIPVTNATTGKTIFTVGGK